MCLRINNEDEYTSNEFTEFLHKCKIRWQLTCLGKAQQNGIAEQKNMYIVKICRSMLHTKNMTPCFWAEDIKTVVHVTNRLPQPKLDFISIECKTECH